MQELQPWLETIGVIFLLGGGIALGYLFSRLGKPWWLISYAVALALILAVGLTRYYHFLVFVPPFSWAVAGRTEFVLLAVAVTMGLTAPLSRLPRRRQRIIVFAFMILISLYYSVMPFFYPILVHKQLARQGTMMIPGGLCLQGTSYTCGPAAAVTALRQLGIRAHEGEIAVLAHSNPVAGTPEDLLCLALQKRFGPEGLTFQYRLFESVDQLAAAGLTVLPVKYSLMVDHYITVLEVTAKDVIVADPLVGKRTLTRGHFQSLWRYSGIVIWRNQPGTAQKS
jgi:hypothetical protein